MPIEDKYELIHIYVMDLDKDLTYLTPDLKNISLPQIKKYLREFNLEVLAKDKEEYILFARGEVFYKHSLLTGLNKKG